MRFICQDLRYAARSLKKNPGFTTVILLTLALGMGVTTSLFTLVNAVLFRPLPYPEPDRLVQVLKNWKPPWRDAHELSTLFYEEELRAWIETPELPLQLMGYDHLQVNLSGGTEPERVSGGSISSSFLPVLGIQPSLGRNFRPEEDQAGAQPVLILNHGIWKRRFGGDPEVVGRVVQLDGKGYTVLGVLPAKCPLPIEADVLLPIALSQEILKPKYAVVLPRVIGRLRPGVNREQARSALERIFQETCDFDRSGQIILRDYQEHLVSGIRHDLLLFLGAVGCVLLIACANVANLLLARANNRQKEIVIRLAMGASRWRIVRQLLTESVLLAVLGAILGLVLSLWTSHLLRSFIPGIPMVQRVTLDLAVLGFAAGVALVTGIAFGLAPALATIRPLQSHLLKDSGRGMTAGIGQHRLRNLLVVAEVALSVLLLLGAGLLLKSFVQLRGVDPGFRPDRILTFAIDPNRSKYPDEISRSAYFEQIIERLRALPGVEAVGADGMLPFSGVALSSSLEIEGRPVPEEEWSVANVAIVNSDYFKTLGIPLRRGRGLLDSDRAGAPVVAVVNEQFVREHFGGDEPLGKRLMTFRGDWRTVVGVVGDVRTGGLDSPPTPLVYVSYLETGCEGMSLAVRTAGDPSRLGGAIRALVQSVDPDQPVYSLLTMEQRLSGSLGSRRLNMLLLGGFAGLALTLAAVGIYGVVSYLVSERTREIGIRLVLGASPRSVLWMILRRGLLLAGAGILVGLLGSIGMRRVIASELYGISPSDPTTFVMVALVLTMVAIMACWFPARRATAVDPAVALRHE